MPVSTLEQRTVWATQTGSCQLDEGNGYRGWKPTLEVRLGLEVVDVRNADHRDDRRPETKLGVMQCKMESKGALTQKRRTAVQRLAAWSASSSAFPTE